MKKRADGRIVKTVVDKRTKKRLYFYGKTEKEIDRKIFEYQQKAEKGRTFAEVADEWWSLNYEAFSPQTLSMYKSAYRMALDNFGEMYINEIRPKDISLYLNRLVTHYKFKRNTLVKYRTIINQIFNAAIINEDVQYNPCANLPTVKAAPTVRRSSASPDEEEIIKNNDDLWLFPFFALHTGMRRGEILAMQWKDIDFDDDVIYVSKSLYFEGSYSKIKLPKTKNSIRVVPLLEPLKEKLIKLRGAGDSYIFYKDDAKKPLTKWQYEKLYNEYLSQSGNKATAHQLRHSFATIAIENDVPMKSVQEILGHQNINTTLDIYTDFRKKSVKNVANALDGAFKKSTEK